MRFGLFILDIDQTHHHRNPKNRKISFISDDEDLDSNINGDPDQENPESEIIACRFNKRIY